MVDRTVLSTEELDRILGPERDVEGMLLRGHLLVERELNTLLASRLEAEVNELPDRLSFDLLARLALAGKEHDTARFWVLTLNKVRNQLAHSVGYDAAAALRDLAPVSGAARTRKPALFPTGESAPTTIVRGTIVAVVQIVLEVHMSNLEARNEVAKALRTFRDEILLAKLQLTTDQEPADPSSGGQSNA